MAPGSDQNGPARTQPEPPARPLDRLHIPVLAGRVADLLAPALTMVDPPATDSRRADPAGSDHRSSRTVLVDATVGMAGHTISLLESHPSLLAIGIDRDHQALRVAGERLAAAGLGDRVRLVHAVYDRIGEVIDEYGPATGVHGILFDLGVSSMQLDETGRGFAYATDGPLDMRMDASMGPSAADVLNTYSAGDLARILRQYGEERFAGKIAAAIVRERGREPFATSARLVELIRNNIPAAARRTGGHPAKRTFQALRVEVNDELQVLRRAIPAAVAGLAVGGRIVVLSYQSLEDRIVKQAIDPLTKSTSPLDLPIDLPGHEPAFAWLTRGSQAPTDTEISENPRAASARLRAAQRIRKAAA